MVPAAPDNVSIDKRVATEFKAKAILFDFDGVVVQSEPTHMRTFIELLAPYGVKVSEDRWYNEFAGTGSKHIFEVLVRENKIKENVDELVEKRKKAYEMEARKGNISVTKGVREFLQLLRANGIKTAIVSGSHRTNVQTTLETLSLGEYFDVIVSGDDLKERKPDPTPYLHAAQLLGIAPADCLVIEDAVAGCEAAKKAKMHFVVVKSPASKHLYGFDAIISNFTEFPLEMIL